MSTDTNTQTAPFAPTWNSLRAHRTPDWLRDGKFGIYCHWGIWTIRYLESSRGLTFDQEIDLFKGENFDPAAWADLFAKAGARFAGPVGWHGSPFVNWASKLTPYNARDRGPCRDIAGELEREIRKRGLKFMLSFHTCFDEAWFPFARETIEQYHPDLVWVDASFGGTKAGNHHSREVLRNGKYLGGKLDEHTTMLPEQMQKEFLAYYFNDAAKRGTEVEFTYKTNDIPPGIAMRDLENGLLDHLPYDVWLTDMDINTPPDFETHGWFFREGIPMRSARDLVHLLVDVVSKNGIMLLNVGPKADGSFPDEAVDSLTGIGNWLETNGEAIYGASPWNIFGEGPTDVPEGHHSDHFGRLKFTDEDIRFTVNGDVLYATVMGCPTGTVKIRSLNSRYRTPEGSIGSVTLLGTDQPAAWRHTGEALEVDVPGDHACEHALVFAIRRT
jgi:alpha-L-fucosidase